MTIAPFAELRWNGESNDIIVFMGATRSVESLGAIPFMIFCGVVEICEAIGVWNPAKSGVGGGGV